MSFLFEIPYSSYLEVKKYIENGGENRYVGWIEIVGVQLLFVLI